MRFNIYSLLLIISQVLTGSEPEILDNLINTDEAVLKAMKNSGVVDVMDEHLRAARESQMTSQDRIMLESFIEEYKSDNNKEVTNQHVMEIVDRVMKNRKPNLPQIFVQLGPIIDVLHQLETKSKSIKIIIAQQAELLESNESTKEIFHRLHKNLKSEVLKQQISGHPDPPKRKQKIDLQNGFLEALMQELFKNKNPAELLSLMNGDMSMISNLLESTDLMGIVMKFLDSYLESSPYGGMIQQYGKMFLQSEQGQSMMEAGKSFMTGVAESNSGRRILKLAPQLLAVKDTQSLMEILGKEIEYNWRLFFDQILNSSYKKEFVTKIADGAVRSYEYFKNPPKNSPINQLPIIINGFLLTYKLPTFDVNSPAKSISALINKGIKLFSTVKIDVAPYIEQAYNSVTESMGKHIQEKDFMKMTTEKKVEYVSAVIEIEMVQPILKVWNVYVQSAEQPKCAAKFLCEVNKRERSSPNKSTGVVKAASYAAAWTLSKASQEIYWKLYHAVNAGSMGADCENSYPNNNCVLDRISHNEL